MFLIGLLGSVFDTLGKACIQNAYSNGPAGPVAAFVEINNVFLVLYECFRMLQLPTALESIGFILGIFGALVLSVPDQIVACFRKKETRDSKKYSEKSMNELK